MILKELTDKKILVYSFEPNTKLLEEFKKDTIEGLIKKDTIKSSLLYGYYHDTYFDNHKCDSIWSISDKHNIIEHFANRKVTAFSSLKDISFNDYKNILEAYYESALDGKLYAVKSNNFIAFPLQNDFEKETGIAINVPVRLATIWNLEHNIIDLRAYSHIANLFNLEEIRSYNLEQYKDLIEDGLIIKEEEFNNGTIEKIKQYTR